MESQRHAWGKGTVVLRGTWPRLFVILALIAATLCLLGPSSPPRIETPGPVSVMVLRPQGATWTDAGAPGAAQDNSGVLRMSKSRMSIFLRFDGSALRGREVVAATLRLVDLSDPPPQAAVLVRRASPDWSTPTLTANTLPPDSDEIVDAQSNTRGGSTWVTLSGQFEPLGSSRPFALRLNGSTSRPQTFGKLASVAPSLEIISRATPGGPPPNPSHRKKVFAHYFPPYPVSLDNESPAHDYYARNYLSISGEGGIHEGYGGLLRDRPLPRAPLRRADWMLEDLRSEVRTAKSAGIDGFTVDILGLSGPTWTAALNLARAARDVGDFTVIPNLDATGGAADAAPTEIADKLAEFYGLSSAQMIDGDYVLSSFAAEQKPPSWWQTLAADLQQAHGLSIKLIAVFLDASRANMLAFAPFSYGLGSWGTRSADSVRAQPDNAALAHSLHRRWMEPVAFQDARPRNGLFAEASNTQTGRASWKRAIDGDSDLVQIVTWNDYSESTTVAPSAAHGSVLLDLTSYYVDWFKEGVAPALTADHLYLTHRIHPAAAVPRSGISNMQPSLGTSTTPVRDTVEALAFLHSPAEVSVMTDTSTHTFALAAGVHAVTVPLRAGSISAEVKREGRVVLRVRSPYTVTDHPLVQDFQYWASGG